MYTSELAQTSSLPVDLYSTPGPNYQAFFYVLLQLRFHVIEARGLLGENLNPTVKVVVGEEGMSTQVAKGTQNPIWNEVCVYTYNDW